MIMIVLFCSLKFLFVVFMLNSIKFVLMFWFFLMLMELDGVWVIWGENLFIGEMIMKIVVELVSEGIFILVMWIFEMI